MRVRVWSPGVGYWVWLLRFRVLGPGIWFQNSRFNVQVLMLGLKYHVLDIRGPGLGSIVSGLRVEDLALSVEC